MSLDFNKLKDNSIVLTGFQFVEQNPLGFFEFDNISEKVKVFENKVQGFEVNGKLVVKNNGFMPIKDPNGGNKANKDIFVVTRAKSRPVLVFQNIEFSKEYHDNVFIIPIQTLNKPKINDYNLEDDYLEKLNEYNDIVNKSKNFFDTYYIPKKQDDESIWERVLVLSDARFVHKSTLYGAVRENELTIDDIEEISIRLSKMINISKLEKCDECVYNYKNYVQAIEEDVQDEEASGE